ncbi:MAG: 6-pyruvoyl tetrahydropterin synthase family protein, partial [Segatella salivae]
MYYIKKSFEISASHHLKLSYQSKCSNVHGHNWHITIYCK